MIEPIKSMENILDLSGKVALITGGNRGLGLGIAYAMCQSGADVAIACRNVESGKAAAEELAVYGRKVEVFRCDIASFDECRACVAAVYESFGKVDILVNNAGISIEPKELLDMDEDLHDWFDVVNVDLNGTLQMIYEVGKRMRDAGNGGSIINITSMAGRIILRGQPMCSYNSSKAAVDHLIRALAPELGKYGIRINGIAPGFTHSDLDNFIPLEKKMAINTQTPMGRFGEPIEIGALAVFLASPAAVQITGGVYIHDGGYHIGV